MKVGQFAFTVQDLAIPLNGIRESVRRSYDTRRKGELLDFGYGWSVDYQDVTIDESREPTFGWHRQMEYRQFVVNDTVVQLQGACTRPASKRLVTVTLPDGDVERFRVLPATCRQ